MEEKNLHVEEGALKVTKLTLYEAVAIIVGANVGSGILGLAYSSRLAGWPILVLWLAVAGLFTTFSMLYVAESALRTKKPLQLPGLAEKYVGKVGSVLIFISVCANSIGCMVAYTTGSGNILCTLLGLPNWAGSLLFTVPCVLVVWFGLKATGLWEKFMSTGMVVLLGIIVIASFLSGKADVSRAVYANWTYAVPLLSSAIFCYIAQYAVPELARGMRHTPKKLPVAIILGMFITGVLLARCSPCRSLSDRRGGGHTGRYARLGSGTRYLGALYRQHFCSLRHDDLLLGGRRFHAHEHRRYVQAQG